MDIFLFNLIHNLSGKSVYLDSLGIFVAEYLIWFFPIIILLFFVFSKEKGKKKKIILLCFLGIILIYFFDFIINKIYFRARPFAALNFFPLVNRSPQESSFPSTHTALAFILAFVIFYIDKRLGILSLFFALFIGLSRIFVGVHWPSDVLAGIILALLSSLIIAKLIKEWLM